VAEIGVNASTAGSTPTAIRIIENFGIQTPFMAILLQKTIFAAGLPLVGSATHRDKAERTVSTRPESCVIFLRFVTLGGNLDKGDIIWLIRHCALRARRGLGLHDFCSHL
jgi:hypothetical protein